MRADQPSVMGITAFRPRVDNTLRVIFDDAIESAGSIDRVYAELLTVTRDQLLRGGKRLRPYLTYLAYVGSGGDEQLDIVSAAASQELFHHYLLLHDDIMDRDLTRHGGPNVSGVYYHAFKARELSDTEAYHFASSYALMAGSATCALGLEAVNGSDFSPERKLAVLAAINKMLFEEMGGQLTDISVSIPGSGTASVDQLLKIARYKTAAYSFITPLKVGAILAGAAAADQQRFQKYGEALGIAFQLADDLLGVYGSEQTVGKPVTSDMQEGKHTLLIHYAFASAKPSQAATLRRLWGNRQAGEKELEEVKELLLATGARDQVTAMAESYLGEALGAIEPFPSYLKHQLTELAHFCIKRTH